MRYILGGRKRVLKGLLFVKLPERNNFCTAWQESALRLATEYNSRRGQQFGATK